MKHLEQTAMKYSVVIAMAIFLALFGVFYAAFAFWGSYKIEICVADGTLRDICKQMYTLEALIW